MNKNTIIGSILMVLIFIAMVWVNQPTPEQIEEQRRLNDSIRQAEIIKQMDEAMARNVAKDTLRLDSLSQFVQDSIQNLRTQQRYGNLAAAATGTEAVVTLRNENVAVDISTRGGMIEAVRLLQYTDYKGDTLHLFNADENENYFTIYTVAGKYVTTKDLYFQPVAQTDSTVTLRLATSDGARLDFIYTLPAGSYVVGFDIQGKDLDAMISPTQPSLSLTWNQRLPRTEKGRTFEERYSNLYYKYKDESPDYLSNTSNDNETVSGDMTWIGYNNQFFSSALISKTPFNAGQLVSHNLKEDEDALHIKHYQSELEFDINLSQTDINRMAYYFGPNDYWLLDDIDEEMAARLDMSEDQLNLQKLVSVGWGILGWINRFIVIPVFHFLGSFISNYGIIILLLTLFIKLLVFPFTYKSMVSGSKMRIFQKLPEVQALNEKYPNQEQAMEKQQAMMSLMGKAGVSSMGGCLPMLLQMPVLLALFYFFPTSIELRGESFLWADDLSSYDAIFEWNTYIPLISWIFDNHVSLFCLLMTVTNIGYQYIMMKQNPTQNSMPGMKFMMYVMPLLFFGILNNYSSGLSYYYFLSTLISILQTWAVKASMNEEKILAEMKDNLKHPKPAKGCLGGDWMARAQEMQRQQQAELRRQQEKRMKSGKH